MEGGHCNIGIESTILYCVNENNCSILRHGIIGKSEIENFCNVVQITEKTSIRASGCLKSHYQPKKPLFYFKSEDKLRMKSTLLNTDKCHLLSFSLLCENDTKSYLFPSCPKKAAKEFYRQLRMADQSKKNIILIELPPETPEWMG